TATSYHKYDIEDYYAVDPEYGTIDDLKAMINAAHSRGILVVMDLVVNHCSVKHKYFIDACSSSTSPYRDYFVWKSPKLITTEKQNWHNPPGADTTAKDFQKYYGFFWSGMPDFNFDNPRVRKEMINVGRFWLEAGVDGFRLDAAQHIYPEGQESKNHIWWKEFRQAMEQVKPDFFMVGEVANKTNVVAPYLKEGMHSAFNFDLAADINRVVVQGRNDSLVERLIAIRQKYSSFAPNYIDATFVTNHDQNRIMNNVRYDEKKAKLAASILLTLPGSPYLYYGEEIGMRGEKPDELIREPFPWSYQKSEGYAVTSWETPVYTVKENVRSLEDQFNDPESIYSHYSRLLQTRNGLPALYSGSIVSLPQPTQEVIVYKRIAESGQQVLVVHNLSPLTQSLDLGIRSEGTSVVFSSDGSTFDGELVQMAPLSTAIYLLQ
ncbi:MAG: hypothetical protein RIQ47_1992, partial [Bacteroidota bacterium]